MKMEKIEIEKDDNKNDAKEDKHESERNPIRTHANKIAKKTSATTVNIVVDGVDTHIPNNLPTAIFGDKGSGKSTLLRSIIDLTNKRVFKHIFFVYCVDQIIQGNLFSRIDLRCKDGVASLLVTFDKHTAQCGPGGSGF